MLMMTTLAVVTAMAAVATATGAAAMSSGQRDDYGACSLPDMKLGKYLFPAHDELCAV